jgi:xylulokinase
MSNSECLIGIDLGTSGVRATIINAKGQILAVGRGEYPIDTPRPGWAEQDPAQWLDATNGAIQQALQNSPIDPQQIRGIGLSGQMHTTVCLDSHGQAVRPAIVWADQRSKDIVTDIYEKLGATVIGQWTANPMATGFTLPSLLWLQRNESDNFQRIAHVLLPKDYLRYYLTGEIGTDVTDASGTAMMDVTTRTWNIELLQSFNIETVLLPPVFESAEVAGKLLPEVAHSFGLPEGIPVVFGGGDQSMQAVGNGIITPGLLSSTIGTGGQLFAPIDAPTYDPGLRLHTFCHALPRTWHLMAAILSAGLSLSWWQGKVLGNHTFSQLADDAARLEPGADDLFFLPYLLGERTPHMDPQARGAFIGLTLRHERAHMTRALMEGVVLALREGLQLMLDLGAQVDRVVASGGGTRHPLWLQLQADIFNRDIYQTDGGEAASRGAALLAGVGAGIYTDVADACRQTVRWKDEVVHPDPQDVERYDQIFEDFRRLYPALH